MLELAFSKLKERKYIIQGIIFFIVFGFLYFILDYLNIRELAKENIRPSNLWFATNIGLNIIMAILSMLLMNLSTIMVELKSAGSAGSNLGFISIFLGIFTYGCTSCVVGFFTAVGIAFSPAIFPFIDVWHGSLYKLLSLGLLAIGFGVIIYNIKYAHCKIPKQKKIKE